MKATHPFQLKGRNGRFILSTLWCGKTSARKAAVLIPGVQHGTDSPVLYYLRNLLVSAGYDVLAIDCRYNENFDYLQMSAADKELYFYEEYRQIAGQLGVISDYEEYIFAAESEGTSALIEFVFSGLLDDFLECSRFIWISPEERNEEIIDFLREFGKKSLYIIPENSAYFRPEIQESLYDSSEAETMVVPDAGQMFEKEGDVETSIDNIKNVIGFIAHNLWA